jgi:hypothetical protein
MRVDKLVTRSANHVDIDALVQLNSAWQKSELKDLSNGFLSVAYDHSSFKEIVNNNDIVVYELDLKIIGYALVNSVRRTMHIQNVEEFHNRSFQPARNGQVGYSYQIILDTPFQGKGLFPVVERATLTFFKSKYIALVSAIDRNNYRSIAAHRKTNWNFIEWNETHMVIEKHLI